jgi:hypothetical protein
MRDPFTVYVGERHIDDSNPEHMSDCALACALEPILGRCHVNYMTGKECGRRLTYVATLGEDGEEVFVAGKEATDWLDRYDDGEEVGPCQIELHRIVDLHVEDNEVQWTSKLSNGQTLKQWFDERWEHV